MFKKFISIKFSFLFLNRNSTNDFVTILSRILHYDFVNKREFNVHEMEPTNMQFESVRGTSCMEEELSQLCEFSILKHVLDFQLLAKVFQQINSIYIRSLLKNNIFF